VWYFFAMSFPPKRVYAITLRKPFFYMSAQGLHPAALLADTELTADALSDPYLLISEAQARLFYLNLVRLADRDGVGLEIGWRTALSDMGPHGMALATERTVSDSLRKTWQIRDNYNLLVDWRYEVSGTVLIHHVHCAETDEPLRVFLLERSLATLQAHTEELLGPDFRPLGVLLDYRAPAYLDQYKDVFRCPLRFRQERTELHYSAAGLDRPIETHDPQAAALLGALRTSLHAKLAARGNVVLEVRMALRRSPGKFPSLEQVADSLAMSSRTLRRKLGQQNVRFQDLLDEERSRVAEDFLLHTEMTIQKIAEQCGFSDAQNFSQSFRRWRGLSPSKFRRTRRESGH
jgi:AraC-like DNA-binding protein